MTETPILSNTISDDTLKGWLQRRLSGERYQHSVGTQVKAVELARRFKLSPQMIEKASIAGLLHDCAKLLSPEALLEHCSFFEIPLTEVDRQSLQTLHPLVGAEQVRAEFGIDDKDILNAIRYHTTGRANMSPVEKVVFLADKIEENTRNPLYTQKIRAVMTDNTMETLDKTVLYTLDSTITFLIEKGQAIHPRTLEARNDMVASLKRQHNVRSNSQIRRTLIEQSNDVF